MPRKAREKSSTDIYHVMMRGINHQMIFDDRYDYDTFIKILDEIIHPISASGEPMPPTCQLYAYALMGNHFHLLLKVLENPMALSPKTRKPEIGDVVKKIASSYVLYFNNRHGRDGHLFRERFKSEPCETAEYFKTLMVYIHQNPVNAGLSKSVVDYPYTSWHEYLDDATLKFRLCNTEDALRMVPLEALREGMDKPVDPSAKCLEHRERRRRALSDRTIHDYMQSEFGLEHPTLVQGLAIKERNAILESLLRRGAGVRQLQRITGVGLFVITRLNSGLSKNSV